MDMLSLVLRLRWLAPAEPDARPLPAWWGRAAQALLLNCLAQTDPGLADALHEGSALRPFTASTLMGRRPNRALDPAEIYRLRFSALHAPLAGALLGMVQPGGGLAPGALLQLDYLTFRVEGLELDETTTPWAGRERYTDLAARRLTAAGQPPRRFSFLLASPTGFHAQERLQPLPLPELFFGSLLNKWNAFAPLALPEDTRRYAAECLGVERFELSSRMLPGKEGGIRLGAVGRVTYAALHYDRYWMSALSALADFARFSGAGVGTSHGLGQCRWLAEDAPLQPPPPQE